ncbi:MAG TPA: glycosyltransferase family 4 protein [Pirellulales bacterium]|nr:glycosyltransferase family 4 protein [Pirellulales bacterium]
MSHATTNHPDRPLRVLFLNRSYWPEIEATGQLLTELCEDLSPRMQITVLAGQPNQNPDGQAFQRSGAQTRHGVEIHRVWNTRFPKRSFAGKAMNLVSYFAAAWFAAMRLPRPDIVVVETDPPWLCLLGGFLRHWFGCRLVVYLQDIYPDIGVAIGTLREGRFTALLRQLFFGVHRRADRVVVLSDEMRQLLVRAGVAAERIVCIPNWIDTRTVRPMPPPNRFRDEHAAGARFLAMYSGNLGMCQRLEDVVNAAGKLNHRSDIRFLIVGEGARKQQLRDQASKLRLNNLEFLPYQPKSRLGESLTAPDVHLIPLDERVTQFLMPSKLYGVLAAGIATVAVAPVTSDLAKVVRDAQCGVVVPNGNPAALADAIAWCADHPEELAAMGRRGRELAVAEYDRRSVTRRFGDLLEEVAGRTTTKSSGVGEARARTAAAPLNHAAMPNGHGAAHPILATDQYQTKEHVHELC